MATRSFQLAKILGSGGTIKAAALDSDAVGGGVKLAENDSADMGTGAAGDLKFASNRKTLHLYDGAKWDRIAGGQDADPVIITDATVTEVNAGSIDSARQTFKVADPEGFPISYSISYMRDSDKVFFTNDSSNLPPILTAPTVITKAADGTATYKFLTRTAESDGSGNSTTDIYKARFMGSDGARQAVSTQNFSLKFTTTFLFDTSHPSINSTYTADNQVEAYPQFATSGGNAYSTNTGKLGKGYLECKVISKPTSTNAYQYGLTSAKGSGGHLFNNWAVHVGANGANATVYPGAGSDNNNSNNVIPGLWSVGDIIQMAYDTNGVTNGSGHVWFGRNGTWPTNYNPFQGDNGWSIGSTGEVSTYGFRLSFGQSHTGSGGRGDANRAFRVEIISHSQGPQYTIPPGWSLA